MNLGPTVWQAYIRHMKVSVIYKCDVKAVLFREVEFYYQSQFGM